MNPDQVFEILKDVSYKPGWTFAICGPPDFWLQVRFPAIAPVPQELHARKWRLSQFMSKSEVVQTALMAVLAAEEHEARENFTYRGRAVFNPHLNAVFNPHLNVDVLHALGGFARETRKELG